MKKIIIFVFLASAIFTRFFAQEQNESFGSQKILYTEKQQQLRVTAKDVKLLADKNGGFHLYVKKTPNINSILLTETTKDPAGKQDSYAYRATAYNKINGDEIRYLDGKKLDSNFSRYSLVDSTVENTSFFGEAFHIYIPETIVYGYEWSRRGEVKIGKGTFINIRTFEKPYADYSGDYMDSPFMFDLVVKKKEAETVLTDDYNPLASEKFQEISEDFIYSKGPETIIQDITKLLEDAEKDLDLVFAIDATGSMKNDIDKLKTDLQPALEEIFGSEPNARIGLLFYRDYGDTFKYMDLPVKCFPFTSNYNYFNKNLNSIKILGKEGGDIPEAVYEAMYAACEFYTWRVGTQKKIILIGDAEPHPTPRGTKKYSKDYVMELAESRGITIHSILLPRD